MEPRKKGLIALHAASRKRVMRSQSRGCHEALTVSTEAAKLRHESTNAGVFAVVPAGIVRRRQAWPVAALPGAETEGSHGAAKGGTRKKGRTVMGNAEMTLSIERRPPNSNG